MPSVCVICSSDKNLKRGPLCGSHYQAVYRSLHGTVLIANLSDADLVEHARALEAKRTPDVTPAERAELAAEAKVLDAVEDAVDAILPASPAVSVSVSVDVHGASAELASALDTAAERGLNTLRRVASAPAVSDADRHQLWQTLAETHHYPVERKAVMLWSDLNVQEVNEWLSFGAVNDDMPGVLTCAIADLAISWWAEVNARREEIAVNERTAFHIQTVLYVGSEALKVPTMTDVEAGIEIRNAQGHLIAFASGQAPTWFVSGFQDVIHKRRMECDQTIERFLTQEWTYQRMLDFEGRIAGEDRHE